jgi:hypothetical protein
MGMEGMSPFRWPATPGSPKKVVDKHRDGEEDPSLYTSCAASSSVPLN